MPASPAINPATVIMPLTSGTTFSATRAIIGNAAGTATVVDASGHTVTGFPITGGEQNVSITSFSSLATTTALWGLY